MPTDFNWQTEEDAWDNEPVVHEKTEPSKKRRWPLPLLAGIAVVAVLGVLFYQQVQRQLEAAVARTENEVRRTHELVLQAADRSDRDLLNSIVSSRDEKWLNQQLELAEEGLLYNPRVLGFVSQQDNAPQHEFEISPDLNEAEVFTTRNFTVQSPTGVSETVALKQYAVYRRSTDRWIFAPPQNISEFWGESLKAKGQYLTMDYPGRDAEEAEQLFKYLDAKLGQLCTTMPDFNCPDDFQIFLTLGTEPSSQMELLDLDAMFENDPDLTLPTLTLVGLPVDEAGKAALYRGYATQVVRTAIINALDWDCCRRGVFFRALVDYQLTALGLSPYPLYPADYETLFSQLKALEELDDYWRTNEVALTADGDWRWAYALTKFALTMAVSDKSAAFMQQMLLDADFYTDWVDEIFIDNITDIGIQQAWLNFLYASSLSGQVAVNQFVPPEDILLYCTNEAPPRTILYRYRWETGEWTAVDQFDEPTLFMISTPDDSAVIIQQLFLDQPAPTFIWRNGQRTAIVDNTGLGEAGYYFIGRMSSDGRKLVMSSFNNDGYALLDLDDCDASSCQLSPVPGLPVWSPDGSQVLAELLAVSTNARSLVGISRIDSAGEIIELTREGFSPFWLSDDEYGYIAFGEEPGIYVANKADDEPHLLLTTDELFETIPEEIRPHSLNFQDVIPNPANRNILALSAFYVPTVDGDSAHYLFLWNRATGELTFLDVLDQAISSLAGWLPTSEWLSIPSIVEPFRSNESPRWSYHLYHVSGQRQPIVLSRAQNLALPFLEYSMNGEWAVVIQNHYLELVNLKQIVAEDQPYRRMLPHDFEDCSNPLFVSS